MNEELKNKLRELNTAIRNDNLDAVVTNLKSSNEVINADEWLHLTAKRGNIEIFKYFVDKGLDINGKSNIDAVKPICMAVSGGHIEIVKFLLSMGAEVDVSHPLVNPLFYAILKNHIEIAKLLINTGMDTSIKYTTETMTNMDAIDFAKEYGCSEIVSLIEAKAK